ncbi:hypothetical protein SDC9_160779 [bioreactor metagenome]|uniref:Uncharacterized protein n=1 Tax=bioreactor metagenome TaxID=1076179 RepID=A0A645FGE4_9ZZZZ
MIALAQYDRFSGHLGWDGQAHQLQKRGRDVRKPTVLAKGCVLALGIDQYEGHRAGRMRGERAAVDRINHLLAVAVIGGDDAAPAGAEDCVHDRLDAFVHRVNGGDRGVHDAGMTDHVRIREVKDHCVVNAAVDALDGRFGNFVGAHFRLKVIGRDLGRGDQYAILALVGRFDAAVEEERHMRVFLGLRDAKLRLSVLGEVFAERVGEALGLICNLRAAGEVLIVLRHADIKDRKKSALARETVEILEYERSRDLACTVGPEIEHDDAVVGADA